MNWIASGVSARGYGAPLLLINVLNYLFAIRFWASNHSKKSVVTLSFQGIPICSFGCRYGVPILKSNGLNWPISMLSFHRRECLGNNY